MNIEDDDYHSLSYQYLINKLYVDVRFYSKKQAKGMGETFVTT